MLALVLIAATVAILTAQPNCAQASDVPQVWKTASVNGSANEDDVFVAPGDTLTVVVASDLPEDVDSLDGCRFAFVDEIPSWLDADVDSVQVTLRTAGGTLYDLTPSFDTSIVDGLLRVQCEALRDELPRALGRGGSITMGYEATASAINDADGAVAEAHVVIAPSSGSAETVASESVALRFMTVSLKVIAKDADGGAVVGKEVVNERNGELLAVTTDESGAATFDAVALGTHQILCEGCRDVIVSIESDDDGVHMSAEGSGVIGVQVDGDSHTCVLTLAADDLGEGLSVVKSLARSRGALAIFIASLLMLAAAIPCLGFSTGIAKKAPDSRGNAKTMD